MCAGEIWDLPTTHASAGRSNQKAGDAERELLGSHCLWQVHQPLPHRPTKQFRGRHHLICPPLNRDKLIFA